MRKVSEIYKSLKEKSKAILANEFQTHFKYKSGRALFDKMTKDEFDFVEEHYLMNWFLSNGYKEEVENLHQVSENA